MALYNGYGVEIKNPTSIFKQGIYNGKGEKLGVTGCFLSSGLLAEIESITPKAGTKIAYLTDLHFSGEGQLMQGKNTVNPYWSLAALEEICKRGLVEAVVIGGDLINAYADSYESTLADAKSRIQTMLSAIDTNGIPLYIVKGNHDLNTKYDDVMGDSTYPNRINDEVWQSIIEPYATNAVFNSEDKAGYYYVDLTNNVRLCIWNQYTGECVDTTGPEGDGTGTTQIYWFRDNAYTDEDGKTIVTIFHNPEQFASGEFMITRCYCDGGTYSGKTWTGGNKAFCITAHNHADNFGYLYDGVMAQNVPNFNVRNAFAVTRSTASNASIDEGNDRACVSIFTVDVENQHVYETRIGKGESRESDFCTVN